MAQNQLTHFYGVKPISKISRLEYVAAHVGHISCTQLTFSLIEVPDALSKENLSIHVEDMRNKILFRY